MTEGFSCSTYECVHVTSKWKVFYALEGVPADPDIHHNIIKTDE